MRNGKYGTGIWRVFSLGEGDLFQGRVLSFSKRLGTLCLQLLHNGAIAGLALLRQLLVTHTAVEQLLDSEHEVR